MPKYIQISALVSYPPSNINRDDLGRPKTCLVGGVTRVRHSSQSQKRAWRTSTVFEEALIGHLGRRTARAGEVALDKLAGHPLAEEVAQKVAEQFGKPNDKHKGRTKQLAFLSVDELARIDVLTDRVLAGDAPLDSDYEGLLGDGKNTVDVAMFGRMLADKPLHNVDGAVMVSHAFSVHPGTVEDDYFTAVDDLNRGDEDRGAGHVGSAEFAESLFYVYVCVDLAQLIDNLGGDTALAQRGLQSLVRAIATTGPKAKATSFGSLSYADYIRVERGDAQPRTLATAFLEPVRAPYLPNAVRALETRVKNLQTVYGDDVEAVTLHVDEARGSMGELEAFVAGSFA